MERQENLKDNKDYIFLSISPIIVFLCVYLVTFIIVEDFYKMPIVVAFIIASAYALMITKNISFDKRINIFSKGVGHENLILMGIFAFLAIASGFPKKFVN